MTSVPIYIHPRFGRADRFIYKKLRTFICLLALSHRIGRRCEFKAFSLHSLWWCAPAAISACMRCVLNCQSVLSLELQAVNRSRPRSTCLRVRIVAISSNGLKPHHVFIRSGEIVPFMFAHGMDEFLYRHRCSTTQSAIKHTSKLAVSPTQPSRIS